MNTVNHVKDIKNLKAQEYHAKHLATYQKKFGELNAKLVNANAEKASEHRHSIKNLRTKYNDSLREYTK